MGAASPGRPESARAGSPISRIRLRPGKCLPLPDTLKAIARRGPDYPWPGFAVFTSIIPICWWRVCPGRYLGSPGYQGVLCHLMWQPGETMSFRASDHIRADLQPFRRCLLDYVVVNTGSSPHVAEQYASRQSCGGGGRGRTLAKLGLEVRRRANLVHESTAVRHNPDASGGHRIAVGSKGHGRSGWSEAKANAVHLE